MSCIYTSTVYTGEMFCAPENITFLWNPDKESFCIWYQNDDQSATHEYKIVYTSENFESDFKLKTTVIVKGLVYHLIGRIMK